MFFFSDNGRDFFVSAFHRERQWTSSVAMRMDTSTRVRAILHQQAHNFRLALQHGVMQSAMLVGTGHASVDEFGPHPEDRAKSSVSSERTASARRPTVTPST